MYLLDTDILSLVQSGHERVLSRRQSVPGNLIATTIITRLEIVRGRIDAVLKSADAEHALKAQKRLLIAEQRLRIIRVINLNAEAAAEFERLRSISKLKKIGIADLMIAAITLTQKAILVTRNVRHFEQVPGLRIENWAD